MRHLRSGLESVGLHPSGRFALVCLTPLLVIGLEASRRAGMIVPLPFGMVYASIAISAGLGGIRIGVASALAAAVFIQVPEEWSISDEGGLGIPGIQERFRLVGGSFSIESDPSIGTRVRASVMIPVSPDEAKVQSRGTESDAA